MAQITTTDNTAISNAQAIPVPTLQDDKAACANQMDPYTYLSCEGLALRGAGPATEARLAQIQTAQTKQQTDISTKTAECNALPDSPTSIQANQVQGGGGGQLNTPTPVKATATAPVSTPTVIQCPAPIDTSTFQKQIDDLTTQNTTLRTQITSMQNTITSLQKIAKQPITPVYVAPSPVATTPVIVPAPIVIPIVQQPKPVGFWQKIINWFK